MSQLQITFRGMAPSENLRALAEARFLKVRQQCAAASRCFLVIERPPMGAREATRFSARVHLDLGDTSFVAAAECRHENANIAVREAFERASAQVGSPRAEGGATRHIRVLPRTRSKQRHHLVLVR